MDETHCGVEPHKNAADDISTFIIYVKRRGGWEQQNSSKDSGFSKLNSFYFFKNLD